ncbi:hypothetical protein FRC15_009147 [Serendipita sp. 397]|nr:hypothetical protein FRC15_009147 [Serendipita sp. 397]
MGEAKARRLEATVWLMGGHSQSCHRHSPETGRGLRVLGMKRGYAANMMQRRWAESAVQRRVPRMAAMAKMCVSSSKKRPEHEWTVLDEAQHVQQSAGGLPREPKNPRKIDLRR